MELRIMKDANEIAEAVSKIIIHRVNAEKNSVLGFATGASPVPTYKLLVEAYKKGEVSFSGITTFNLDEYCGIPAHCEQSYRTFMRENLFGLTDVCADRINFLDGNAESFEAECDRYKNAIAQAGGIDLQILGIGTNGHIGFNEPSDSFSDGPFAVELTDSTKKSNSCYFPDGKVPDYALTMGAGDIMRAKSIVLIATGEAKAKAIKSLAEGEITPECPCSILQKHDSALIFVDEAAASLLSK